MLGWRVAERPKLERPYGDIGGAALVSSRLPVFSGLDAMGQDGWTLLIGRGIFLAVEVEVYHAGSRGVLE